MDLSPDMYQDAWNTQGNGAPGDITNASSDDTAPDAAVTPESTAAPAKERSIYDRVALGLEGFGAGFAGQKPLAFHIAQQEAVQQQHRDVLKQRQAYQAAQIKQQQDDLVEKKRQNDMSMVEKILGTGNIDALEEYGKANPGSPATLLSKALTAKHVSELPKLLEEGYIDQAFVDKVFDPDVKKRPTAMEIAATTDMAMEERKANFVEERKRVQLQRAMKKPADQRTAFENNLVEENQAALDLKQADIDLKKAQAEKAKHDAETSRVTQMTTEISNELFDKDWGALSSEQKTKVEAEKERRLQARTSAMITGTQLAAAPKIQADMYTKAGLDNLELEQAPSGLTPQQYATGPYRQLDEKEKDALVQYKVAVKTVDTMNKVADHLITATTPTEALRQKLTLEKQAFTGENGIAKAYKEDKASFSSRMARLVEVGVLTNTDVTRWESTFGSFGDTKQTLKAKQALFGEIQDETARLLKSRLGGIPSHKLDRSRLDKLLDKASGYTSTEDDLKTLGIPQR